MSGVLYLQFVLLLQQCLLVFLVHVAILWTSCIILLPTPIGLTACNLMLSTGVVQLCPTVALSPNQLSTSPLDYSIWHCVACIFCECCQWLTVSVAEPIHKLVSDFCYWFYILKNWKPVNWLLFNIHKLKYSVNQIEQIGWLAEWVIWLHFFAYPLLGNYNLLKPEIWHTSMYIYECSRLNQPRVHLLTYTFCLLRRRCLYILHLNELIVNLVHRNITTLSL